MDELGAPWADEPIFEHWKDVQAYLMRVRGDVELEEDSSWMPLEEVKGEVLKDYQE